MKVEEKASGVWALCMKCRTKTSEVEEKASWCVGPVSPALRTPKVQLNILGCGSSCSYRREKSCRDGSAAMSSVVSAV